MGSSAPNGRPLAVVTGASSGVGLELARQFAQHEFDLVIAAEDADIARAADDVRAEGVDVTPVLADLATFGGVEQLYDRASAVHGGVIDALAVNAGIGVSGVFTDRPLDEHLQLIALNITGGVHLAHRVMTGMVARGEGRVLFTSSIAATMPGPYAATYAASKAFLASLAEGLRVEMQDRGVTVTALMPGPTETEFFDRAGMNDTRVGQMKHKDDPADVARDGFEALMAGKDHVVAGSVKNRVQAAMNKALPDRAAAAMHAAINKPESEG